MNLPRRLLFGLVLLFAGLCTGPAWAQTPCTGTPTAGTASTPSPYAYCFTAVAKVLTLSGYSAGAGIAIQWQSSPDSLTFASISGATGATYTAPISNATTYYRAKVTCTGSGSANSSNVVCVAVNPNAGSTATVSAPATACAGNSAAAVYFEGAGGVAPYTITYNVNGGPNQTITTAGLKPVRYIRLEQNAASCFNLAEMQAIDDLGHNRRGPVTSDGYVNSQYPASNLVDGDLNNFWLNSSCVQGNWVEMGYGWSRWFGMSRYINEIRIVNRPDCCQAAASNLQLILKDDSGYTISSRRIDAYQGQNTNFTSSFRVTYATLPVPATAGTYQYNLVSVTDATGCTSASTDSATVNVQAGAVITTQPAAQTICAGQPLSLSVGATNAAAYQWQKNGRDISNATAATYSPTNTATPGEGGSYTVVVTSSGTCGTITSDTAQVAVVPVLAAPLVTDYAVCQNAAVPVGSGLAAALTETGSYTVSFSIPEEYAYSGIFYNGSGVQVSHPLVLPPLPPGATITSVAIKYDLLLMLVGSRDEIRLGLTGAISLTGVQPNLTGPSFGGNFNYNASSVPTAFNPNGGSVFLTYWDSDPQNEPNPDVKFSRIGGNVATAIVRYSYPAVGSIKWYAAPTGGTALVTGLVFDPSTTPGSGVSGTGTIGSTTFYAARENALGCPSPTRTPVVFTVDTAATATISAPADVCVGGAAAVTLSSPGPATKGYVYSYNVNGGATQTTRTYPKARYIHIRQNVATCFSVNEILAFPAGSNTNVAAGKPATASSTASQRNARYLTDGAMVPSGTWQGGSCDSGIWVEVDLGQEYSLTGVQIVPSSYFLPNGIPIGTIQNNLQLILKDSNGVPVYDQQISTVGGNYIPVGSTPPLTLPVNTTAAGTQHYNLTSVSLLGRCATSPATSATVTVHPQATISAEPQASLDLCAGNPLLLSVAATGATTYQWNKNGSNISGAATSNYTVTAATPADTGSYQVIAMGSGGCNDTSAFAAVTVSPMPTTLASGGTAVNTPQPDGYNLIYTDANCQPLAAITDNAGGNLMGLTNASVSVDATVQTFNGAPYLQRHYDLTPASNGPAIVKLYATQAEFDAFNSWITTNGNTQPKLPTGPSDAISISHIRINQFHGLPSAGTTGPEGHYDATQSQLITSSAISTTWNGSYWTMSFPVTGFSGFFITSGTPTSLPVELVRFEARANGTATLVSWTSAGEDMLKAYEVERSADGRTFATLATVAAAREAHSYQYADDQPIKPVSYYRLRMTDADGTHRYSNTVRITRGADNGTLAMNVYPNPATDLITISHATGQGICEVRNMIGQLVLSATADKAETQTQLRVAGLAPGMYQVSYRAEGAPVQTAKFVKQ
ncbi:MAG: T9SS type A sorting domain-containing protein [Sphingobacteriales bacterium]|nr:MAG: T9SS type A sorting domain-containing protein [Sphingobacteriales bacterium]